MNNPKTMAIFIEGSKDELQQIEAAIKELKKATDESSGEIYKHVILNSPDIKTAIQLAVRGSNQLDLTDAIADAEGAYHE